MFHRMTHGRSDYKFEEIEIDDSGNLYNGCVELDWEYESADKDVGYRGGFDYRVTRVWVNIPANYEWEVPLDHPVFGIISNIMKNKDSIQDFLSKEV